MCHAIVSASIVELFLQLFNCFSTFRYEIIFAEGSGRKATYAAWTLSPEIHPDLHHVTSDLPHRLIFTTCLNELVSVSMILTSIAKASSAKQGDYFRIAGGDKSGHHIEALIFSKAILEQLADPAPPDFQVCSFPSSFPCLMLICLFAHLLFVTLRLAWQ